MFGAPGDPREWVKVANSLLALVASGGLRAGDPLPAMGTLAGEHDVNVGTVARAFRALAASGVIWRVPGLGYYVERKITVDVREPVPGGSALAAVRAGAAGGAR